MNILFDSGWLDFAADESQHILVTHNLGTAPKAIQMQGKDGEILGFPKQDGVSGPYLQDTSSSVALKVFKPDAYNFSGQFKIVIYG